jgi:hypothetical protein
MSGSLTEEDATNRQSAACSRTSWRRSAISPTKGSEFIGTAGTDART